MNRFVRDKDNLIHVSNDNWKTFETMKKRVIDGTEEINRDVISTIKLRYELGDTLAKIIVNEQQNKCSNFD